VLDHDEATQERVMHLATLRPDESAADAAELHLPAPDAPDAPEAGHP
jgi:ribose transport system ATP-binding protein